MPATSKVTGVWHWEEPLGDWQELTTLAGAVFSPGRGYNLAQNPEASNDGLFSFRGTPVTDVAVTATSPYADVVLATATREAYDTRLRAPGRTAPANWGAGGWNLLGNPYNAALLIADPLEGTDDLTWGDEFLEANLNAFDPSYVAVYLYDGTADAYYYIGHNTGGWDEPAEGAATGAVPPGQGFFILAMNNSSVFTFTPEMQVHACTLPLKAAESPARCSSLTATQQKSRSHPRNSTQTTAFSLSQASRKPRADSIAQSTGQDYQHTLPHRTTGSPASGALPQTPTPASIALPVKAIQSPAWPGIRLFVRSGSREASTLVVFHEGMTEGLDPGFDIGLMSGGQDPEIFTTLVEDNGTWFARQALPFEVGGIEDLSHTGGGSPSTLVIPVGVNSISGGPMTFSAQIRLVKNTPSQGNDTSMGSKSLGYTSIGMVSPGSSSFDTSTGTFFLEDREANVFTDLKTGNYNVDLPPHTQGTGRFFLHYSPNGQSPGELFPLTAVSYGLSSLPKPTTPSLRIVPHGNELLIFGELDSPARYEIIDLSGRIIASGTINSFSNSSQSSVSRAIDSGTLTSGTIAFGSKTKMSNSTGIPGTAPISSGTNKSGVITTKFFTAEDISLLPIHPENPSLLLSQGNPSHLQLPHHHCGILLVRISNQRTHIVCKFTINH
jgi:hypothetical protein